MTKTKQYFIFLQDQLHLIKCSGVNWLKFSNYWEEMELTSIFGKNTPGQQTRWVYLTWRNAVNVKENKKVFHQTYFPKKTEKTQRVVAKGKLKP